MAVSDGRDCAHPSARRSGGARLAAQSAWWAYQPAGGRTWPPVGMAAAADRATLESIGKGGPRRTPRQYYHGGGRVWHAPESRTCRTPVRVAVLVTPSAGLDVAAY